ncbi:MAG: hypothetical protein AAEI08_04385 [Gammaproteobacteria bacterium]
MIPFEPVAMLIVHALALSTRWFVYSGYPLQIITRTGIGEESL